MIGTMQVSYDSGFRGFGVVILFATVEMVEEGRGGYLGDGGR